VALAALAGAVAGLLVVALIDPEGRMTLLDTIVVTVGVFAGIGLDRLLRG
jgi:hypothetical protein